jgi:hypothetical protein
MQRVQVLTQSRTSNRERFQVDRCQLLRLELASLLHQSSSLAKLILFDYYYKAQQFRKRCEERYSN